MYDDIGLRCFRSGSRLGGRLLFFGFLLDRPRNVRCVEFISAGGVEGFLRPGWFGRVRPVVEHITAVDHDPGDLQHGKAKGRNQDNRQHANVTEGFHAARLSALLGSENAWAAAATAWAADTPEAVGPGSDG